MMFSLNRIKPQHLKKGDTIGIVAPAWSFDPSNFKKGVKKLRDLGFRVKYDRSIFSKYWSMAGFDKERAEQINRMFADKTVKAIFCAKAGYGSIRTLPYLDKNVIARNPKIFVGYSDITILLSYLEYTARMVVFHGPVVSGEMHEKMNSLTLKHLLRVLGEVSPLGEIKYPGIKMLRPGRAKGILVGGNLSMLVSSIGTPYEVDTDNKILFLEDVGEDLEEIDNDLMQLRLAGKLRNIKGLILGRMINCRDNSGKRHSISDVINAIFQGINMPMINGFPSGHRRPGELDIALPFGVSVTLDADNLRLIINESAVR